MMPSFLSANNSGCRGIPSTRKDTKGRDQDGDLNSSSGKSAPVEIVQHATDDTLMAAMKAAGRIRQSGTGELGRWKGPVAAGMPVLYRAGSGEPGIGCVCLAGVWPTGGEQNRRLTQPKNKLQDMLQRLE
jgi:hypothetical protein